MRTAVASVRERASQEAEKPLSDATETLAAIREWEEPLLIKA